MDRRHYALRFTPFWIFLLKIEETYPFMIISEAEISRDLNISSWCSVEAAKNTKLCKLHEVCNGLSTDVIESRPKKVFFPVSRSVQMRGNVGRAEEKHKNAEREKGRACKRLFKYCLNPPTSWKKKRLLCYNEMLKCQNVQEGFIVNLCLWIA